jgi:hypothetical protein
VLNFLDKYNLIKGQSAFGVEVVFNTKDSYTLIALELKSTKEGIEVSKRFIDIPMEELSKKNTKKLPVYFTIGGKGVIHKKLKADDNAKDQELLNQVLPNASIKDFYLQKSKIEGFEYWVSVVRKDVLDNLITKIKRVNLFGVQLCVVPFVLENTIQLLDKMTVLTTSHELLIENNNIIQIDSLGSVSNGEEYNVEDEIINSHELIAFGSAFNHFVPSVKLTPIFCDQIREMDEEHLNKNKLVTVGFAIVSFFFLVVMINLIVASNLESTHNQLQYQVNSKKGYVVELKKLEEELKRKEQFIQGSGVARASKISYYTDQIALSVSEAIQLNQMFVNPLEKKINKAEDINFNFNSIKISGTVSRSIELNNWIKELKQYEWITEINIISFIQDNYKTAGEFELEVKIK